MVTWCTMSTPLYPRCYHLPRESISFVVQLSNRREFFFLPWVKNKWGTFLCKANMYLILCPGDVYFQICTAGQGPPHRRGRKRERTTVQNPSWQPVCARARRSARGIRLRREEHVEVLCGPRRPSDQGRQRTHLLRRCGPE